jgi:hypothetical protein
MDLLSNIMSEQRNQTNSNDSTTSGSIKSVSTDSAVSTVVESAIEKLSPAAAVGGSVAGSVPVQKRKLLIPKRVPTATVSSDDVALLQKAITSIREKTTASTKHVANPNVSAWENPLPCIKEMQDELSLLKQIREADEALRKAASAEEADKKAAAAAAAAAREREDLKRRMESDLSDWTSQHAALTEKRKILLGVISQQKFEVGKKSIIPEGHYLYPNVKKFRDESAAKEAELAELNVAISISNKLRPETYDQMIDHQKKVELASEAATKHEFHSEVDKALNLPKTNPLCGFTSLIQMFLRDGKFVSIKFSNMSPRQFGPFNGVCVDPLVFERVMYRSPDKTQINVFHVDQTAMCVRISDEFIEFSKTIYRPRPDLPLNGFIHGKVRETLYYFLEKVVKQIAVRLHLQPWQILSNSAHFDKDSDPKCRECVLSEIWTSVSTQSRREERVEPSHFVRSNPFQSLSEIVDVPPSEMSPASTQPLRSRGGVVARGGHSGSVRSLSKSTKNIDGLRNLIPQLVEKTGGFSTAKASYSNPLSYGGKQTFDEFMRLIPDDIRESFEDVVQFLQKNGIISNSVSTIESKNNKSKQVYLYLGENGQELKRGVSATAAVVFTIETATALATSDEFVVRSN